MKKRLLFKTSGSCCAFVWVRVHAPSVKRMHRWGEQEAGQVMGAGAAKHFMSPLKRETWSVRAQMYHMAV